MTRPVSVRSTTLSFPICSRSRRLLFAALTLVGSLLAAAPALAANATTPGTLSVGTTLLCAGFEWNIVGDDNDNCAVTLEYRRTGTVAWLAAQPLLRVEHGIWTQGETSANLLAGSLFGLEPGTAYEARLTLSDADGGADQRTIAFTTRTMPKAVATRTLYVVPGTGGGTGTSTDPFRGLAAANTASQAGDLFLVQPGTYSGMFTVTHDGTAAAPITYRGTSAASVIVDGLGGTSGGSHSVLLASRHYVFVENMSFVNCLRPVSADNSVGVVVRGCLVRPINQLLTTHGIEAAYSQDMTIVENRVEMPGQWATIGRTGSYGTGGYGIIVEGTGHVIAHNTVIEAWDAISIPVTGTGVPAVVTSNVDIYENDIDRATDDAVQADATHHNVRIFANRMLNVGAGVSFQPIFGGPGYALYNEMYNVRNEPWKFHKETSYGWTQETSGMVVMHNTTVCSRGAWTESGIWRHGMFRENLMLGARSNTFSIYLPYTYPATSFDRDGYNRVGGYATLVRMTGASFSNLPAWYAGMGNEQHGKEVAYTAFVNAAPPHDPAWEPTDGYGSPYTTANYDLRPATGSPVIDAGALLANVDDAFRGTAPELGCHETGEPARLYGPHPVNAAPLATVAADGTLGRAPYTVHFTGDATDVDGLVVGRHWDFGDGTSADGVSRPTHAFAAPGRYLVTFTASDEDGAPATASLFVNATTTTDAGDGPAASLALRPARPTPFAGSTTIGFLLPAPTAVTLCILDLRGAIVRTLASGVQDAGDHELAWDGRDDAGRAVAPGLYFCRLAAPGTERMTRLVRLR